MCRWATTDWSASWMQVRMAAAVAASPRDMLHRRYSRGRSTHVPTSTVSLSSTRQSLGNLPLPWPHSTAGHDTACIFCARSVGASRTRSSGGRACSCKEARGSIPHLVWRSSPALTAVPSPTANAPRLALITPSKKQPLTPTHPTVAQASNPTLAPNPQTRGPGDADQPTSQNIPSSTPVHGRSGERGRYAGLGGLPGQSNFGVLTPAPVFSSHEQSQSPFGTRLNQILSVFPIDHLLGRSTEQVAGEHRLSSLVPCCRG